MNAVFFDVNVMGHGNGGNYSIPEVMMGWREALFFAMIMKWIKRQGRGLQVCQYLCENADNDGDNDGNGEKWVKVDTYMIEMVKPLNGGVFIRCKIFWSTETRDTVLPVSDTTTRSISRKGLVS